jgi:hypothetical protein
MTQMEQAFADQSNDRATLREEAAKLGRELRSRIEAVSQEAENKAGDIYKRVEARVESEIDAKLADQIEPVNTRLWLWEASNESSQTQVANLQQDVGQLRRDMAEQADVLAAVQRQAEESNAGAEQRIATLRQEARQDRDQDRQSIETLADELAVRKIPFEVSRNQGRELAEGISLHVDAMDPTYGRVSGWMWIMGDRRTIWLHNQNSQEPLTFYGYGDGQKRELVFTNVAKNSVAGYLYFLRRYCLRRQAQRHLLVQAEPNSVSWRVSIRDRYP